MAVVGYNPGKTYAVTPEERVRLINQAIADDPALAPVEAVFVSGEGVSLSYGVGLSYTGLHVRACVCACVLSELRACAYIS